MIALAGYQLGVEFRFFDPNAGAPVGQIGQLVAADYGDTKALEKFLDGVDVVTYEFESIPLATARFVAERARIFPPLEALETAQDRLLEKQLFRALEIPTPEFAPVDSFEDLGAAAARMQSRVTLTELMARIPDFEVDEDGIVWAGGSYVRRPLSVPFKVKA